MGKDQTHVSASALRTIGVRANAGDTIFLKIDFFDLLQTLGVTNGLSSEEFVAGLITQYISQSFPELDISNVTIGQLVNLLQQAIPININIIDILSSILGFFIKFCLHLFKTKIF